MKVTTRTRRISTTTLEIDGTEVELMHSPCEWKDMHAERIGNKLVVAYNVHDSDSSNNPMKDYDGQGELFTMPRRGYGGGVITDDEYSLRLALRVNNYDAPDIDHEFKLDGKTTTLRDLAADQFADKVMVDDDLASEWADYLELGIPEGGHIEVDKDELRKDLTDVNGCFCEQVERLAVELYSKHWQDIVGPYVVPVSYHSERGDTSISTTDWDGDPDDLPSGVWVGPDDIEVNLLAYPLGVEVGQIKLDTGMYSPVYELTDNGKRVHEGTLGACLEFMRANYTITNEDRDRAVREYADAVLSEYESWCNGDVYGCVLEVFQVQEVDTDSGDKEVFEQVEEETCWGFIGSDHAEESLKSEFFMPTVSRIKSEVTTTV